MNWQPIETAPKDGSAILVNDTTGVGTFVLAKWLEGQEWQGWTYDDELFSDCNPTGPEPTYWLPIPSLPEAA